MATSKKKSTPPKETIKEEGTSAEIDHGLKVAPTMPYYCTWLPGACPAETKAANAQTLITMVPPMCPPQGAGAATIIPTFVPPCPTMPVVCVHTINPACPTPGDQKHVNQDAQTATIITCTGIPVVCGMVAQPQTILPPSLPPACLPNPVTGIPFVCHQGAGAQAQTVMVPPTSHVPPYCPAGAQAQTIVGPTAYLGCNTATTTVQTGVGTPAQAQGTIGTISAFPPACLVTAIAHCFTAATCAAPAQAKAQTIINPTTHLTANTMCFICPPPTIPGTLQAGAAQAQGITGAICSLVPTICLTTEIAGCNAAGAQAVGDTFANPACHGGRTLGATCNTMATTCTQITCGGITAQAQTVYPVTTLCMPQSIGCPPHAPTMTATTTVQTAVGAPAQAQGTIGTISAIPPACLVTALAHCFTAATCAQAQTFLPTTTITTPQGAQAQAGTVLTAQPTCAGIYTNACGVGAQAQAALSPTTTVAHQTLATVCTQTGPINTIATLNGCPRPTLQTQIGCVTQPPICFYTTVTQPIGQCPPAGTGPQPQTVFPTFLPMCPHTHPLATCPPQGVAQAQGISGVFCGVTKTIVNTITITTVTV